MVWDDDVGRGCGCGCGLGIADGVWMGVMAFEEGVGGME